MTRPVALAVVLLVTLPAPAQEASYDHLLYGWMKLKGEGYDFYPHADSYLKQHHKSTWARAKGSEFKLEPERVKAVLAMKERAEKVDLTKEFTLTTRLTFGKYDFDARAFPLTAHVGKDDKTAGGAVTAESYWFVRNPKPADTFPDEVRVSFSNPELLATLPMTKQAAETLTRDRKESQRVLTAKIQLRLTKAGEKPGELVAEVQAVTLHDTVGTKALVKEITKPTGGEKTLSGDTKPAPLQPPDKRW